MPSTGCCAIAWCILCGYFTAAHCWAYNVLYLIRCTTVFAKTTKPSRIYEQRRLWESPLD